MHSKSIPISEDVEEIVSSRILDNPQSDIFPHYTQHWNLNSHFFHLQFVHSENMGEKKITHILCLKN